MEIWTCYLDKDIKLVTNSENKTHLNMHELSHYILQYLWNTFALIQNIQYYNNRSTLWWVAAHNALQSEINPLLLMPPPSF